MVAAMNFNNLVAVLAVASSPCLRSRRLPSSS
jgi:hypothetical protein